MPIDPPGVLRRVWLCYSASRRLYSLFPPSSFPTFLLSALSPIIPFQPVRMLSSSSSSSSSSSRSPRAFLEKRRRTCAVHPIEFQKISNAASLLSILFVDTRRISQGESRYLEGKNVPADPIDQILRGISISMDIIGNRYSILPRDGSSR